MGARVTRSIHVAGVIDLAEAQLLIDCGIRYLGFPLVLDHHKEDLTIDAAVAIVSKLRNHATFFLVTYLNKARAICELCDALSVDMVQLHGQIDHEQIQLLRQEAPKLRIIKSLIVRGGNAGPLIDEVQRYGPSVDLFITDTFDPTTGASGATGRVHDWQISRRLVESSNRAGHTGRWPECQKRSPGHSHSAASWGRRAYGDRRPRRAQAPRFDEAVRRRGKGWVRGH